MNIKPYVRDENDILNLSQATDLGLGQSQAHAIATKLEEERTALEERPQIVSQGDITRGVRYRAGLIAGLKWLQELQGSAAELLKKENSDGS